MYDLDCPLCIIIWTDALQLSNFPYPFSGKEVKNLVIPPSFYEVQLAKRLVQLFQSSSLLPPVLQHLL